MKLTAMIIAAAVSLAVFSADVPGDSLLEEEKPYSVTTELSECDAVSAAVYEPASESFIYTYNADEKRPVGHLAKLMTYLIAAEMIDRGELSLDDTATVSAKANSMEGAQIWLDTGEVITTDELLRSISVGNANDACVALAERIAGSEEEFVTLMNNKAASLGMNSTHFADSTGLSKETVSTVKDIVLLEAELCRYDELTAPFRVWMDSVRGGKAELVTQNRLVRSCKGIIGFKVCSLDTSGECAAIAIERNSRTLCSVMLGVKNDLEAECEAKDLIETAFAQTELYYPSVPEDSLDLLPVKHGEKQECPIMADKLKGITLRTEEKGSVTCRVALPSALNSPVRKGETIGSLTFYVSDSYAGTVDIKSCDDIESISFGSAFKKILGNLLKMS
ncbi:MAG: D-alanyl-D-alanine carboxypeptidase [Ruminococcus sp.]|nr:D-alanyl-D-alanine carboxypeptidase [Ruminococcus sp.]